MKSIMHNVDSGSSGLTIERTRRMRDKKGFSFGYYYFVDPKNFFSFFIFLQARKSYISLVGSLASLMRHINNLLFQKREGLTIILNPLTNICLVVIPLRVVRFLFFLFKVKERQMLLYCSKSDGAIW